MDKIAGAGRRKLHEPEHIEAARRDAEGRQAASERRAEQARGARHERINALMHELAARKKARLQGYRAGYEAGRRAGYKAGRAAQ